MESRHSVTNDIFSRVADRRLAQEKGRASMRAFGIALLAISGALVLMVIGGGPKAGFLLPVGFTMIVMGTVLVWLNTRQDRKD